MLSNNSPQFKWPHLWTMLAFVVGAFGFATPQLIGHVKDVYAISSGELPIAFGWPGEFLDRTVYLQNDTSRESDWWLPTPSPTQSYNPLMLILDVTFCLACLVTATWSVERFCRHYCVAMRFRVATLIALMCWVGIVLSWELESLRLFYLMSNAASFASFVRIVVLLICLIQFFQILFELLSRYYDQIADWPNRST